MGMRRIGRVIVLLLLVTMAGPPLSGARAALAAVDDIFLTARHVLLIDVLHDEVLYTKAAKERAYPASLTKIMTSLLILEYVEDGGSLDEIVTATVTSLANVSPHGSRIDPNHPLQVGEEMMLLHLLYSIIIPSANDSSDVVAEHISGSVEAFVERMNQRAAELGLEDTHFMNTHGLHDPGHYTTAWDVYRMVKAAMEHPLYLEICHTETRTIPATNMAPERILRTTNRMMQQGLYYYPQAIGIKTGFTTPAGYCLVATARQGDLQLVSVVMRSEGPRISDLPGAVPHNDTRMNFVDTRLLMQWGFANFERRVLLPQRDVVSEVAVRMGLDRDYVQLWTANPIEAIVPKELDLNRLKRVIVHDYPDGIDAPVVNGQIMGTLTLHSELCNREAAGQESEPCTADDHCGCVYGTTLLIAAARIERSRAAYIGELIQDTARQPWLRHALMGTGGLIVLYVAYVLILNRFRRGHKRDGSYRGSKRKHKRRG